MITHYTSCQQCQTVSSNDNSVNSVNSYSALLPPYPMVFLWLSSEVTLWEERFKARWEKCSELFSVWTLKAVIPKLISSNSTHLPIQKVLHKRMKCAVQWIAQNWMNDEIFHQNILNPNLKEKQVVILEQIWLDQWKDDHTQKSSTMDCDENFLVVRFIRLRTVPAVLIRLVESEEILWNLVGLKICKIQNGTRKCR